MQSFYLKQTYGRFQVRSVTYMTYGIYVLLNLHTLNHVIASNHNLTVITTLSFWVQLSGV